MVRIEENKNTTANIDQELTVLPMSYGAVPYVPKRRKLRPWVKTAGKTMLLLTLTIAAILLINI